MRARSRLRRALAAATAASVLCGLLVAATAAPVAAQGGEVLRGVASNRCIEVPGSSTTNGTQLELRDCTSEDNQLWELDADKRLVVYGSKCMDIGGDGSVGSPVVINDCTGSADQQWELDPEDLSVRSVGHPEFCVDAWGAGSANGTPIAAWWCNGQTNQQWKRTLEDEPASVSVDLAKSTGPVYGGATGVLYGLSDDGVASDDLVAGQRPRTLAQKPPNGEQHPNGDVLDVSESFFANGGEQMVVYMQDVYSRWPYQEPDDILADYLPKVRAQMNAVVDSGLPMEKFAWVPFNEPDGIWYQDWNGGERENFFRDWDAVHAAIREIDPDAVIVGPNEATWHADRVRQLLEHAKEAGTLPDVMAWHELGTGSLGAGGYRAHLKEYRQIEADLGVGPLPINIDEYGNRHDMGNPGRLIQWLTMLEDTKVDGDMAFWTYAGNLSDHAVQTKMANGGWWLNKWYSDLSGHTVEFTPEAVRPDTMQGIATLDEARKQATVLVGGNALGGSLLVQNIPPEVFGDTVDVYVETTDLTGQEGEASAPMVNSVQRLDASSGSVSVPIEANFQAAHRVSIVPATNDAPAKPSAGWHASYEAEDATLVDAQAFPQAGDWSYAASNLADVGAFNKSTSRVSFDIEVPEDGKYELGILHGSNKRWGQHALYIDDKYAKRVTYSATLDWTYRARAEVPVKLTAGAHTVSLRASDPDGPLDVNYDITLDRLDVFAPEPDTLHFPLWQARLKGDFSVDHSTESRPVSLEPGASAQLFVGAPADGYYDLVRHSDAESEGQLQVLVSDRDLGVKAGKVPAGEATVSTTVYLHRGVNEIRLANTGSTTVAVPGIDTVRNRQADTATVRTEAEALQLEGAATASSRWASNGKYVGDLGNGGSMVWNRPGSVGAGEYVLNVAYAQNELNLGHPYNTDVVTRFLDASEAGAGTTRSPYRNNYSWDGFWPVTSDLTLTTDGGALKFDRSDGWAPNVDWLSLSPLTQGTTIERITGFYDPVAMGGTLNTVRAGATVPLAFEVFVGDEEVSDASAVTMSASDVPCADGTPVDDVAVASAGRTGLRYDTTMGTFVYNWRTPKAAAGSCFDVTAATNAAAITAHFRLR